MDPQAYDSFTAALREALAGRPDVLGLVALGSMASQTPAGRVSPTTTSSSWSSPPPPSRCGRTCPGCPGPTPYCCPSATRRTA